MGYLSVPTTAVSFTAVFPDASLMNIPASGAGLRVRVAALSGILGNCVAIGTHLRTNGLVKELKSPQRDGRISRTQSIVCINLQVAMNGNHLDPLGLYTMAEEIFVGIQTAKFA